MLKKYAYKFILHNKFNPFELDFDILTQVLKENNIKTLDIESNQNLINTLSINNLNNTFFYKIEEQTIIFYRKSLNYKDKIFSILHELGHITLNHTGSNFNFEQEQEANLFACEVLFPSVLINYANYNNVEKIVDNSLLDYKQANFYIKNISRCNMNNSINEAILHKFKNRFLEQKEQPKLKKHKYIFTGIASIVSVVMIIASISIFNNNTDMVNTNTNTNASINNSNFVQQELPINAIDTVKSNDVFVTKTGSKYHLDGCHHLKNRTTFKLNIEKDKDILKKYEPCKVCFPN